MQIKILVPILLPVFLSGTDSQAQTAPGSQKKMLVAYFSHTGNTRAIARQIQVATGADVFEIVPANPYPESYGDVLARGRQELKDDLRPELKSAVPDIASYDVVFVGSPNWFNTVVPPVMTFLSARDFSGKTIVPFVTHGGVEPAEGVRVVSGGDDGGGAGGAARLAGAGGGSRRRGGLCECGGGRIWRG